MAWTQAEVIALFELPFMELMYKAQSIHRDHFDPNEIQASTLLNIKTGQCPEDCGYCAQSVKYDTGLKAEKLMPVDEVIEAAKTAKAGGATRFCMGAAWRTPPRHQFPQVLAMVETIKAMGLETCMTLGMLNPQQAEDLKKAGLDYYNHNIDTAPEYYDQVITTRTFQDRLDTLEAVRNAGINVCCGGIMGMGESREHRASFLIQLANLPKYPESVPINLLAKIPGTPFADKEALDPFEFIRTIAVARILMPKAYVRLSAGREEMSEEMQAWCFFAGANSIFFGEILLTIGNPAREKDYALLARLGMRVKEMPSQLPTQTETTAEKYNCHDACNLSA